MHLQALGGKICKIIHCTLILYTTKYICTLLHYFCVNFRKLCKCYETRALVIMIIVKS